ASRFAARLEQAGGSFVLPPGEVPGLAIGLGGVGVSLNDLVALYAGLARLGTTMPLTERRASGEEAAPARRLLDPAAAWYVGSILIGTPPPENAAGGRIAVKTGTSYGRPGSETTARRYSTPSGRSTTRVSGTSSTAMPWRSRNNVVTCTVSPER